MKHSLLTMILVLVLPAWGHAIEAYQSKPIEVQRGGTIAEHRAADIPVDRAREVEVYNGTPLTADDAAPPRGKRSPKKGNSLVKGVESAAAPAPAPTPAPKPVAPPQAPKKSPPPAAAGSVDYLYTTYQCYRLGFNGQSMITNVVFTLKGDGTYIDPVNNPGRYRLDKSGHTITFLDGNLKPAKGSYEQMRDGGPRVYLSYDESGWSGLNCAKR